MKNNFLLSKKIKHLIKGNSSKIKDWDNIIISKNGDTDTENHIYNNSIIKISFPVKPTFNYEGNFYKNDFIYKYESYYEDMLFGMTFGKHYPIAKWYANAEYGSLDIDKYEEYIEDIKKSPFKFLESILCGTVYNDCSNKKVSVDNFSCITKRRFNNYNLNVVEYFSEDIELKNNFKYAKGQMILFPDDMMVINLFVLSTEKKQFNNNYYDHFVNSIECTLNIKDYLSYKKDTLTKKLKIIKESVLKKINEKTHK